MGRTQASISEIVNGRLYIGNLSAAQDASHKASLGITHIVSVCPQYPSTGPHHLTIPVEDHEYEDILVHLPQACGFIQQALESGGTVLVHCVMGISRSATVLAAYLMLSRGFNSGAALRFIKERRREIHPNYGFARQLEVYAKCDYKPKPSHPAYRSWKRRHTQDVTAYLHHLEDIATIVPESLLLTSNLPSDSKQAISLLEEIGTTHLLTISPFELPDSLDGLVGRRHSVEISEQDAGCVSNYLKAICDFIVEGFAKRGCVLIYSQNEARACIAACAYLMIAQKMSSKDALAIIQEAVPLFTTTDTLRRHLKILDETDFSPPLHPSESVSNLPEPEIGRPRSDDAPLLDGVERTGASATSGTTPIESGPGMDEMKDTKSAIQEKAKERPANSFASRQVISF